MYVFKENYILVEVPQMSGIRKPVKGLIYTSKPTLKAWGLM